jgi:hypothetical protein
MIQHEFMLAEPFPHLVMDDFAPEATLRAVAAGFDCVSPDAWVRYSRPVKKITPLWNRAVLFETSAHSFHGHTEPLCSPPEARRKSVAVYFWSEPRARARFFARADDPHDAAKEAARLARSGAS